MDGRTSYPYQRLAEELGIHYGLVLAFADAYERNFKNLSSWEKQAKRRLQFTPEGTRIIEAAKEESLRREYTSAA